MSPIARVGGVALSVVAHVGAGALLLTLSVADWSQPLFVDLVERAEAPGAGAVRGASGAGARPQPSVPTGPPAPRATEARKGAAPTIPSATSPPALMAQAAPPTVAPAPADPGPTPPSSPSLPAVTDPPSIPMFPAPAPSLDSTAAAAATPGTPEAPEVGAGSRPAGETRGEAGGTGATLALGTPGPGAGAIPVEYGPYLQRFRQRVQEALVYPLAARRQGLRGSVELEVRLDPTGRVRDVRVARSSSHGLLDDAAIETIRHLEPLPFPESLPRRALLIRLPLVFDLR